MLRGDIQKYPHGYCEAGMATAGGFRHLSPCAKRARWLVAGILLCGGCKREAEKLGLIRA